MARLPINKTDRRLLRVPYEIGFFKDPSIGAYAEIYLRQEGRLIRDARFERFHHICSLITWIFQRYLAGEMPLGRARKLEAQTRQSELFD